MKPYFPTTCGRKAVWINSQKDLNTESVCLTKVLKIPFNGEVETLDKSWCSNTNRREGT